MTLACSPDRACSSYTIILLSCTRAHPRCHKDKPTETWATQTGASIYETSTMFLNRFHDHKREMTSDAFLPNVEDFYVSVYPLSCSTKLLLYWLTVQIEKDRIQPLESHLKHFSRARAIPATVTHNVWSRVILTSVEWRLTSAWPPERGFLLGESTWEELQS